jgi:tetratricopeptide (TPR) repeat protein
MIEEPKGKPLEGGEESPEEALPGRSEPDDASPEPSLSRGDSIRRYSARAFRAVVDSFRWLVGGKVRISATVGVFAAFIVAIGFTLFDMQREDWMLEQMYPQAISSEERHVLHARDLIYRGQYAKAESILRRVLRGRGPADPNADALFYLGKCLVESAEDKSALDRAQEICESFIEEFSTDSRVPAAHGLVADALAKRERYGESTMRYKKVLRIAAKEEWRGEIEFLIARNHYMSDNLPATLIALEEIRQKYPDSAVARDAALLLARALIKYGRVSDAENTLSALADEVPNTPHAAAALKLLAETAADAGDYERSMSYCVRWFKESPLTGDQPDIMLLFALAKLETGAPKEALGIVFEVAELFPKSPKMVEAIVIRGRAHEALGQNEEAEGSYIEAVELAPEEPSPRENLVRLYRSTGRLTEALEQMEIAAELAPDKDSLWLELARLRLLNDNNERAFTILDTFTRERQLSPRISEAFLMLADLHAERGDMDKAYRTIERLAAIGTTATSASVVYDKQAEILASVGLYADAIEKYRLSEQSGAEPDSVRQKIAEALLASGKPQESFDELAAIDFESKPRESKFDLLDLKARTLLDLGRHAEAGKALRESIELRSGRENFSTLALLMQANLALRDHEAAEQIFELTLNLIRTDNSSLEAPAESRRIILDWADRLYEEGEYIRAARAYASVGAPKIPKFPVADAAWALYQQGNCHYHVADYARADKLYARLAAEFAGSEWVRFADARIELMSLGAGT